MPSCPGTAYYIAHKETGFYVVGNLPLTSWIRIYSGLVCMLIVFFKTRTNLKLDIFILTRAYSFLTNKTTRS